MTDTATAVLTPEHETARRPRTAKKTMKATVFHGVNDIRVEEVPRPTLGPGEAVIRVTLTTICGTDLHIVRGEYPVQPGLIIGHEPVGVIEELGVGVTGYHIGERVLVGAITPCGQCGACLCGHHSQCGHGARRPRGPSHRHHALPWRQGADAPAHGGRSSRTGGPDAAPDPHLPAGAHRRGLPRLRRAAGWRAQGGDPAVDAGGKVT
jgi:hypothetical protein